MLEVFIKGKREENQALDSEQITHLKNFVFYFSLHHHTNLDEWVNIFRGRDPKIGNEGEKEYVLYNEFMSFLKIYLS